MFVEEVSAIANAAVKKLELQQKSITGYFIASILGGAYIGFGVLLAFTIGGLLEGAPYTRIIMGLSFGVALSLVVIAGAELFTGNNMVMAIGVMRETITFATLIKLWMLCWIGNLFGSVLLALIFWGGGLATGSVGTFIAKAALTKMSIPFLPLLLRGILCNILVCLAVWCGFRCKSDSGKMIMIFWCLFAFITTGFEHSIANMTLLSISLLSPMGEAVTIGGFIYNVLVVSLGNIIGGAIFVALPYYIISKEKA